MIKGHLKKIANRKSHKGKVHILFSIYHNNIYETQSYISTVILVTEIMVFTGSLGGFTK